MANLNFGKKLMLLRKDKKITQKQLSEFLGVGIANITRYESGSTQPAPQTIVAIANFFGVSTDYLLKDDQDFVSIENKQILSLAHKIDKLSSDDQSFLVEMIQNYLNKFERTNGKG